MCIMVRQPGQAGRAASLQHSASRLHSWAMARTGMAAWGSRGGSNNNSGSGSSLSLTQWPAQSAG